MKKAPEETYTVSRLNCGNCQWAQWRSRLPLQIPKGRAVGSMPCPVCACKALKVGPT